MTILRATAFAASTALALSLAMPAAFAEPPKEPRVIDFAAAGKTIGKRGGTLRMLMGKSKDISQMTVYGGARLVAYDTDFKLKPDILAKVENEGNKVFTLHIREGHKWSDGTPFTAEDFRYWWEDVANNDQLTKGGVPRELMADGKGPTFEVIDERTVRYSWDTVNPLFLTALAAGRPLFIYMPAHYMKQWHEKYADPATIAAKIESEQVQNWSSLHKRFGRQYRQENPDMPMLQPWVNTTPLPAERIVYKRNPHYHRVDPEGTQLPYIDEVTIGIVSKGVIAAKAGTGDVDLQGRYLRFDNYAFLKKGADENNYEVRLWPSGKGAELALLPNLNAADENLRNLMQDARVRRALSLGIDRTEINETIFFGLAREAGNSVLPDSPLYDEAQATAYATYDTDKANALLDEAGLEKKNSDGIRLMANGEPFEIVVETAGESSQETDILQLIADHWKRIGVAMFVKPSQRDILRGRVSSGEAVMSTWEGLNRGLATPSMNPEELAPVSPVQAQWPDWGLHTDTGGSSGSEPTIEEVRQLSALYKTWRQAPDDATQEQAWRGMLAIFTDQVFTIGVVAGGQQPIVVHKDLRNVPEQGVWSFEPTLYFGAYMPDTFWWDR